MTHHGGSVHILFLTDNFPPEVNAPASRTFEHCRRWVAKGHRVTVVTCAPNFPLGQVFGGYRNRLWQSEEIAGIRVIRVWTFITRNEGFVKRVLDYLSFMVMGFVAALFVRRVDLVIGTSPQFFTACAAYVTSRVRRRPWVFELRDLWPESIHAVGAMKASRVLRMLEDLELFLYRKADAIIAVTHSFKDNLIARGIDGTKIEVVTNGVDTTRFSYRPKDRALEAELGLAGKFVVGYVGTHGLAHGLGTLLDTAALLQKQGEAEHVRILMLGDGAQRAELEKRAIAEGLEAVRLVSTVPKDEVARYWSLLDASVIHLKRSDLFKTVIPSKMFECMAMGLPILHGIEGESARIVEETGCGVLFEPENAQALYDRIISLKNDESLRARLREGGIAAATNYDRGHLADEMLDHLVAVADRKSAILRQNRPE